MIRCSPRRNTWPVPLTKAPRQEHRRALHGFSKFPPVTSKATCFAWDPNPRMLDHTRVQKNRGMTHEDCSQQSLPIDPRQKPSFSPLPSSPFQFRMQGSVTPRQWTPIADPSGLSAPKSSVLSMHLRCLPQEEALVGCRFRSDIMQVSPYTAG